MLETRRLTSSDSSPVMTWTAVSMDRTGARLGRD